MAGSIILSLALILSIFSLVTYWITFRGKGDFVNLARVSFHGMVILVLIASTYLLYLLLTHQYQYHYVYSYSSDNLSVGFLISTFWAGQEGSFMLWLLMTSIIGIVLQSYTSKRGDLELSVMAVFTLSTTFLLAMVSPLLKNPFAYIWAEPILIELKNINPQIIGLPVLQSYFVSDPNSGQNFMQFGPDAYAALKGVGLNIQDLIIHGKGLNPLLQNFWMQIHPPILFTGFSMSTVPFAFAMSALLKNDYKDWVRQSFPWTLAGAGILGLGIMLGGYWAYGVLGWGGYWAWDPVENSSLVPWLVSVAAIHTMIVQRKTQGKGVGIGRFAKTNLILCILIYVLVVYSTFLTRSGILGDASVHSFVDPGTVVYLFLLVFIGTYVLLGIGMVAFRWKSLSTHDVTEGGLLSRELALFTGSLAFVTSAIIVLLGTSAPIIKQTVETSFYNEMHVPLAIIIGLLNGISLILQWRETTTKDIIRKSKVSLILSLALTIIVIVFGGVTKIMMILLLFSAFFTLFVNVEIGYRIFRGNKKMIGSYIAHIGIAIFIIGVVGSAAYGKEKNIDFVKGQKVEAFGYDMTFTDYSLNEDHKYAFNIDVRNGYKVDHIRPVMFISEFNNGLMREPDILTGFTKDLYISPLSYDDGTQTKAQGSPLSLQLNEETTLNAVKIKYSEFVKPDPSAMSTGGDFQMGARLTVTQEGKTRSIDVLMKKDRANIIYTPVEVPEAKSTIQLTHIDHDSKKVDLLVTSTDVNQVKTQPKEILSATVSTKPFISFVWIGILVMVIGFAISTVRRLKETIA